jgi:2'-5' RNA ligase
MPAVMSAAENDDGANPETGGTVRAFLAVDPGDELRRALAARIERYRTAGMRVTWVSAANLHLSLAFLGGIPRGTANALPGALAVACASLPRFGCRAVGAGFFGRSTAPKIVWAGVERRPEIFALQAAAAEVCRAAGIRLEERPYSPHITLGRVREAAGWERLRDLLAHDHEREWGTLDVAAVVLMRSDLRPNGPVYSPLARLPLAG